MRLFGLHKIKGRLFDSSVPEVTMIDLINSHQRQKLKALGHHLKVVAWVGQKGVTPAVISQIDRDIEAHELIKIKVAGDQKDERRQFADQIADSVQATLVQNLGKMFLLYRPSQKPKIQL